MTRRKGEITLREIKRKWPHHVAISADKVRGVVNSQIVWNFAATLRPGGRPSLPVIFTSPRPGAWRWAGRDGLRHQRIEVLVCHDTALAQATFVEVVEHVDE